MKNQNTLKTLIIVSLAVVLAAGAFGGAYLLNNRWEKENGNWAAMKAQIAEDNPQVEKIYRLNYGPHCDIMIVLNSSADFDQAEAIFTDVLVHLNIEETRQELITYHAGHTSGELALLSIDFRDPTNEVDLYRFTSFKDDEFEKWIVDDSIEPDKENWEYNMSDYAPVNAE